MTAHKPELIKKHKTKPVQNDFSALDAAVEELTRHNTMLERQINGDTEPKRPELPTKRRSHTATMGRSIDIVHPGGGTKKPLRPKIDHRHQAVSVIPKRQTPERSQTDTLIESQSTTVIAEPKVAEVTKPLLLEAPHTDEGYLETHKKQSSGAEPNTELIKKAVEPELLAEESSDEAVDRQVGELYANNLVQSSDPAGYTPHKDQPDLAVFDAKDYHAELHDWSRLAHRSSWRRTVLLGLLLLVLGVVLLCVLAPDSLPSWVSVPGS